MRLAGKFAIILALLSIISISTMGYLAYQGGRDMIIDDKYGDLTLANDYTIAAIRRWLNENIKILEILAGNPFFKNEFQNLMASHNPFGRAHLKEHHLMISELLKPLVSAGSFSELFILRPSDGVVNFSTSKRQEEKQLDRQPFFIFGKSKTHVQNVYYSMFLQQVAMTISTPIRNQKGKLVGVLAGHLNLAELSHIMEQGRTSNNTLDTFLVNKFNFFVTEPRFGKNFALKRSIHSKVVQSVLSGKTGIALYNDYRNVPVIGAYRWIPQWELGIISEIDQAEAFGPIFALRNTIITVCAFIAVFAALLGWLLASTITRPLKQLKRDAERIATGNLDFSIRATGKSEVGELASSFNQMLEKLSETLVSRDVLASAKEQIQEEKEFTDRVINSLPGVFYLFDQKELRFRKWNRNFETVTGYSASEMAQMTPLQMFDEQEGARVAERIGQAFQKGHATVEADFLTKDGDRIPYFFTGYALKTDNTTYLIGMGIDISERKRAEEALRISEDRFRRLSENAKDMIYRMSLPDGRYEYVSPASIDVFGYPPEIFYEKPLLAQQLIHPDWVDYFKKEWENLLRGEMPPYYEYQIIDPSGRLKWLNQRNVLIRDEKGNPNAIEGIVTDITEVKRVTAEQIRLEKFAVLGQVAAGVAHELNNPLMGILNYTQYCIENTPESDEKLSILEDVEHETKRCIGIVKSLLGASRIEDAASGEISEFDSHEILSRVVRLMEYRTRKENVKVILKIDEILPKIKMGPEAFQQLCLNLLTNAVDAVETTETKKVTLRLKANGKNLNLVVSDTGCGIRNAIKDKIFDPFFTTKEPGKGTGLGLAACWRIVHQRGGKIHFEGNATSGTTITVTLPIE
jgi:PAS domain S-box-containing protein